VNEIPSSPSDPIPATLGSDWVSSYKPDSGDYFSLTGAALVGGGTALVAVGTIRGSGGPFLDGGSDFDGWMIKIDPDTGSLSSNGSRSSTRLDSVNFKNDFISNICEDRVGGDSFYVVGTSEGKIRDLPDDNQPPEGTTTAFIAKVRLEDLTTVWIKHFTMTSPDGGPMDGDAEACVVTNDASGKNIVYVAGTISDGAIMDGATGTSSSYGQDDIFVASLDGFNGDSNWVQQIGSAKDDALAQGQGLAVDNNGNVIVFANTYGDWYGKHSSNGLESDLVVFNLNKSDGGRIPVGNESVVQVEPKHLAFGVTALVILMSIICFICVVRHMRRKEVETQKSSIFAYLQQFDVEDVDLRKSPPGGWHGTYLNELAYGVNKSERNRYTDTPPVHETAPLTHSSVVTDSLFMDTKESPSLKFEDNPEYHDDSHVGRNIV
jgi:hypothetical protein